MNSDSRLIGLKGINDFGQAVINNPANYFNPQPVLFTPTVANGASGSFTQITALPGAGYTQLQAINNNGTIIGASCATNGAQPCEGFLWAPTSANGTVGVAAEIPLPTGFVSMAPMALNNGGQVVGTMLAAGGGRNTVFIHGWECI